jgi:flagellar export protein FliJ
MTASTPTRPWHLLAEKAQRAADDARQALQACLDKLNQLHSAEQRLSGMLSDYRHRHQQQLRDGQLMSDQINSQRFIQQLQQLHFHAMREVAQCRVQRDQLQQQLVAAQLELDKMRKLVEQEQQRVARKGEKAEAKRLDEMAVMRFRVQQV